MQASVSPKSASLGRGDQATRLRRLEKVIGHASHVLPAQGPITVFIHHNTLHAFEDLPFHEAVKKGAQVFGCHPYLSEDRYRDALARGRIRFSDLQDVLEEDLGTRAGEEIPCFGNRLGLWLAMLQYPLRSGPTEELVWYVAEANALRRVRSEVSSAVRSRLIAETRRWVIRDLRAGNGRATPGSPAGPVSDEFGRALEPLRRSPDRDLDRRRLGRIYASSSLEALLRRRPRLASVYDASAAPN